MKQYIISIIGATLLSAMANIMAPDSWRKYINIITGFIIISCIIAPVSNILDVDLFDGVEQFYQDSVDYREIEKELIISELKKSIAQDIEKRFLDEFGESITATVELDINENNEIEKISHMLIKGASGTEKQTNRMCEVYGINEDEVEYE